MHQTYTPEQADALGRLSAAATDATAAGVTRELVLAFTIGGTLRYSGPTNTELGAGKHMARWLDLYYRHARNEPQP